MARIRNLHPMRESTGCSRSCDNALQKLQVLAGQATRLEEQVDRGGMTHQENAPRAAACQSVGPVSDASTDCQDGQGSMITAAASLTVSSLSIQTVRFRIWTWRGSLRRFGRDRTADWTHRHRCREPWRPAAVVAG